MRQEWGEPSPTGEPHIDSVWEALGQLRPERRAALVQAGRDYTIYCAISGHRAAGMEAVIHVRSRSNTP